MTDARPVFLQAANQRVPRAILWRYLHLRIQPLLQESDSQALFPGILVSLSRLLAARETWLANRDGDQETNQENAN